MYSGLFSVSRGTPDDSSSSSEKKVALSTPFFRLLQNSATLAARGQRPAIPITAISRPVRASS